MTARRGRPAGNYIVLDPQTIIRAIRTLKADGCYPSQEEVGSAIGADRRTLQRACQRFGSTWADFLSLS